GDTGNFWQRVRTGYQLGNAGVGTCEVIDGFDIDREVASIFAHKSAAGHGAHSDYCRVAGRSVNEWLAKPGDIPAFLAALQKAGWIKRCEPVENSRFWGLLQGPRAEMFGVFSSYELQVIHDWIRGAASCDGMAYNTAIAITDIPRRPSFRVAARLASLQGSGHMDSLPEVIDSDLQAMLDELAELDDADQHNLLVKAMSPSLHWTPAGLHATRLFCQRTA
ncbi:MAG: iron-containing redox enzyme family protein, partial [Polaromonas sp.]